jgi:cellulose synthase/poly-beta-1,6-N-acetylglucosamine synthase-like glycosyltransferase
MKASDSDVYPRVSVIVPVKNGAQQIGACIERLQAQRYPARALELIVVDNGSTDGTAEICRQAGVKVVREETPGPSAARNAGVTHSSGELLLFTDADCLADQDWVAHHVSKHLLLRVTRPEVQIVGGGIVGVNRSFWALCDDLCSWSHQHPALPALADTRFAPTANLSVTRSAFEQVGGFDEELLCGEDTAFCVAAGALGLRIQFEPRALVSHVNRTSFRDFVRHPLQWTRMHPKLLRAGVMFSPSSTRFLLTALRVPWLRWLLVFPVVAMETTRLVRSALRVGRFSCLPLLPFLLLEKSVYAFSYVGALVRAYDATRAAEAGPARAPADHPS